MYSFGKCGKKSNSKDNSFLKTFGKTNIEIVSINPLVFVFLKSLHENDVDITLNKKSNNGYSSDTGFEDLKKTIENLSIRRSDRLYYKLK
jgi:hypothetical protein